MAAPVLRKAWQIAPNQVLASQVRAPAKQFILIKDILKGVDNGWAVKGSSDSVAAGMDNVDRLTDYTKIVNSAAGARSWIVLRQASGLELLLAWDSVDYQFHGTTVVSRAGFGAAAGGTNGSTTARPTATDQRIIGTGATPWGPVNVDTSAAIFHVWHAEDGLNTMVAFTLASTLVGLWLFGRPVNVVDGWTDPLYAFVKSTGGSGAITKDHIWLNPNLLSWSPAGAMDLYGTTRSVYVLGTWPAYSNAADSITGEWPLTPIGLQSETVGARGRHGVLPDLFFVAPNIVEGSTMFDHKVAILSEFAFPWNGEDNVTVSV